MKVLWTDSAVAQLQAIHDYIAQTSPDYAVRIVDRHRGARKGSSQPNRELRSRALGYHPYLIGFVDTKLDGEDCDNIFGSDDATQYKRGARSHHNQT